MHFYRQRLPSPKHDRAVLQSESILGDVIQLKRGMTFAYVLVASYMAIISDQGQ